MAFETPEDLLCSLIRYFLDRWIHVTGEHGLRYHTEPQSGIITQPGHGTVALLSEAVWAVAKRHSPPRLLVGLTQLPLNHDASATDPRSKLTPIRQSRASTKPPGNLNLPLPSGPEPARADVQHV